MANKQIRVIVLVTADPDNVPWAILNPSEYSEKLLQFLGNPTQVADVIGNKIFEFGLFPGTWYFMEKMNTVDTLLVGNLSIKSYGIPV